MTRVLEFGQKGPLSGKSTSLVVFLHGYGADGQDLLGLADVLGPHLPDTLFVAPDAPEPCHGSPMGRQWFPIPWIDGSSEVAAGQGLARSTDDLNAFLDGQMAAFGATATALVGFSQGAMMAMHVAPRRATAMAAVVAISGRLLQPGQLEAETVVRPPVLLIHGDQDPVVPFADMGAAGEALAAARFEVFGHVMQGTGHGIAPDGLGAALRFLRERLPA